jgi:SAM-dependent methyltransferase
VNTQTKTLYNEPFFDKLTSASLASARAAVPIVLKHLPASSAVDFGCGRGSWLKACLENGVKTILGLDGDYVNREKLLIDREQFRAVDLRRPIKLEQQFDLALCLEVGEHLPARSAPALVESLAAAAPVVLFSAALPGQGGVSHLNEQWPPYWERLFAERGMHKYDIVRPLIWSNRSIAPYYRQNIYLFSDSDLTCLSGLEHFEPEFNLVLNEPMTELMYPWKSRIWKNLARFRRKHPRLSRFTWNR